MRLTPTLLFFLHSTVNDIRSFINLAINVILLYITLYDGLPSLYLFIIKVGYVGYILHRINCVVSSAKKYLLHKRLGSYIILQSVLLYI